MLFKKKALYLQKISNIMKYNELERKLVKSGCYPTGHSICGHPEWYSPITGKYFKMSHHKSQEIAQGTLKSILKDAGI